MKLVGLAFARMDACHLRQGHLFGQGGVGWTLLHRLLMRLLVTFLAADCRTLSSGTLKSKTCGARFRIPNPGRHATRLTQICSSTFLETRQPVLLQKKKTSHPSLPCVCGFLPRWTRWGARRYDRSSAATGWHHRACARIPEEPGDLSLACCKAKMGENLFDVFGPLCLAPSKPCGTIVPTMPCQTRGVFLFAVRFVQSWPAATSWRGKVYIRKFW